MKQNGLIHALMYRFGKNESALLLLAVTIAAAGFYAQFVGDLALIQAEEEIFSFYAMTV